MLQLKNIIKDYKMADTVVHALQDVSIDFRENEFVSILGHSGCGKTTLLNIIGGLDHYTSGDLIINGKSTKTFKDRDWDAYRNHSIGFVFQSYNLIPHQTVISNVELALTLSGVSKSERRKRAKEALEKVGLGDQLTKKPNQLSGGQMQRVAIARALVNNPDILLADEPTGALDTATSVQIMELLKEIAKDKLVIMVTHNPELARDYSTRIIRLSDGKIIDDSNPIKGEEEKPQDTSKTKKPSMSFLTALSLSLNNLLTKKGRTLLTAFAGSIGIIGIALILSLSNGIQNYIDKVQEDTLSSYPIMIQSQNVDTTSLVESLAGKRKDEQKVHEADKVYSNDLMYELVNAFLSEVKTNNLSALKKELETEGNEIAALTSDIQYVYNVSMNIFEDNTEKGVNQVNPNMVMAEMMSFMGYNNGSFDTMRSMMGTSAYSYDSWTELIENQKMLEEQYTLLSGSWPKDKDEVILIINKNNEVSDLVLYSLGLRDKSGLKDIMAKLMKKETFEQESIEISFDDIFKLKYRLVIPTLYYDYDEEEGHYVNRSDDEDYMKGLIRDGLQLKIVGIVKPNPDAASISSAGNSGGIGYTAALTRYVIEEINKTDIVKAQKADPKTDVLTGLPFKTEENSKQTVTEKAEKMIGYFRNLSNEEKAKMYKKLAAQPTEEDLQKIVAEIKEKYSTQEEQMELLRQALQASYGTEIDMTILQQYMASMSEEEVQQAVDNMIMGLAMKQYQEKVDAANGDLSDADGARYFDALLDTLTEDVLSAYYDKYMPAEYSDSTYADNLKKIGVPSLDSPDAIYLYANSFESKDKMAELIENYSKRMEEEGKPENVISYTDYVGIMMSSISDIINIISYVLIAFVSISLVVSSIMIGIITYISVLERTKEIGILRAIGASKKDISHVFNAEAITIGFIAGALGIIITLLLNIPINIIIKSLTDVSGLSKLPWVGGIALVGISIFLTFIAGMFPSHIAAKKDPVEALRTE